MHEAFHGSMLKDVRVYTGGTFDLPHPGHINLLKQCQIIAGNDGVVTVSLNTDEFIKQYKGHSPIMTYQEREAVLKGIRYVSEVIPNIGGSDSKPAILQAKPNFIVVGSDWQDRDYYKQMDFTPEWLKEHHIGLVYVPYTEGISTTDLKQRMIDKWLK